jgi:hypothetical protein
VNDKNKLSIQFAERNATVSEAKGFSVEQNGASVKVSLKGYATEEECAAHPIVLSGSTSDGELDLVTDGMVCIQLNGVTLSNPGDPVIDIKANGKSVFISTLAGTTNKLTSGTNGGSDGNNVIESDGNIVLDGEGTLDLVSYAKHGVSSDLDVVVKGGTITSTVSAKGKSNFKVDGSFSMSGGSLDLTNKASVLYEPNAEGGPDTTSGAGIKVDGDVSLTGGTIKIAASGTGGKGINTNGKITFGGTDVTISTTGEGEHDSHAKGVKAEGDIVFEDGNITVSTTGQPIENQTQSGGPEGIESKKKITINGGNIAVSSTDDAINAKENITINGGQVFAIASANDAIDSNGDVIINDGLVLAYGNDPMGVEQGMDADIGYEVKIKGGTVISMGGTEGFGGGANPTYDIPSITVEPSSYDVIKIADASGRTVAVFEIPSDAYTTSTSNTGNNGGWGGGGWNMRFNAVKLLFASESLNKGTSYTVSTYAAGTASGSKWQGWYGANGTVSGNASSTTNATAQ